MTPNVDKNVKVYVCNVLLDRDSRFVFHIVKEEWMQGLYQVKQNKVVGDIWRMKNFGFKIFKLISYLRMTRKE